MTSSNKTASGDYVAWCDRKGCGWNVDGLDAFGAAHEVECHEIYHMGREMFRYGLILGVSTTVRWTEKVAERLPMPGPRHLKSLAN